MYKIYRADGGLIFIASVISIFLYFFALFIFSFYDNKTALQILEITISNGTLGRAAGLSVGYLYGFTPLINILLTITVETIIVLFFYSSFILGKNAVLKLQLLDKWIESTHKNAKEHKETVNKYGIIGLVLFVIMPFFMTGPTVGAIIGYFLGFSHRKTLSIVLFATYIAVILWSMFIKEISDFLSNFDTTTVIIIVGIAIFTGIIGYLIKKRKIWL
ncbi:MAG: small multi-drug export protein [Campylobacterales bacterium]|nr:small multi-drug export protein [Campylobacterales bacterium]